MGVRLAAPEDAPAIAAIYRPEVEETAITFEREPPTAEEMRTRVLDARDRYPWLVCERGGAVVGYASAGPFRSRPAYQWSVETSVYVDRESRREGVARALYESLLSALDIQGYVNAYAVVALPNPGSVAFHEALGFERAGTLPAAGFKLDDWHDVGLCHRRLGELPTDPDAPLAVADARRHEGWEAALDAGDG